MLAIPDVVLAQRHRHNRRITSRQGKASFYTEEQRTNSLTSTSSGRVSNVTKSSQGSLENTHEKSHTELVPYPYYT